MPFFANYGFHLRLSIEPLEVPNTPAAQRADTFADYMSTILEFLREQTLLAQACYEDSANRSRSTAPKFAVDQLVWLNAKNIKTLCPRKKLN